MFLIRMFLPVSWTSWHTLTVSESRQQQLVVQMRVSAMRLQELWESLELRVELNIAAFSLIPATSVQLTLMIPILTSPKSQLLNFPIQTQVPETWSPTPTHYCVRTAKKQFPPCSSQPTLALRAKGASLLNMRRWTQCFRSHRMQVKSQDQTSARVCD
ncbi:uncharacterized protein EI97DRAFT_85869 [Westerdykella ornata]|uniref:Uncharacterized protein n=1 Tax=Westerdykella ornata TaxID=318751 RepID=A0A6A6JFQ1_WESOR|nr:uncharacterized protein EI97DRAFT_85869 [Westerdykella ornata]KAF2275044.1 hypothetical protein EI97DRAFT_85869 [Westerdykella ornata]